MGEHNARLGAIVDHGHLAQIREQPTTYAPGGMEHLILEVLAYVADEAESAGRAGRGVVTLHADDAVSVADEGRGTDTRVDAAGRVIKKPVMATKAYEHGVPTTDLTPIADDGTTGTTVRFQPDTAILSSLGVMTSVLQHAASWPHLRIEIVDKRPS